MAISRKTRWIWSPRPARPSDKEERREIFRQIAEMQLEECTNLPVSWRYVFFAMQPEVQGLRWDVEDRVIMADVWLR